MENKFINTIIRIINKILTKIRVIKNNNSELDKIVKDSAKVDTQNLYQLLKEKKMHLIKEKHANETQWHLSKFKKNEFDVVEEALRLRKYSFKHLGVEENYFKGKKVISFGSAMFDIFNGVAVECSVCIDPTINEVDKHSNFRKLYDKSEFINAFWEDVPFAADSFDVGFSLNCLDHTDDPEVCIKETSRLIKSGGSFYLGVIAALGKKAPNYKHPHRFDEKTIEKMITPYFNIDKIYQSDVYLWAHCLKG